MTGDREPAHDPPRLAEWLLGLVLHDRIAREGLLGDLREGYARRREIGSPGARTWYWRQAIGACARYAYHRVTTRREPARTQFTPPRPSRRPTPMTNLIRDLRNAVRALSKTPGLAAACIMALTLGVGLPTIMFTVINGVFRPPPIAEPERVVRLVTRDVEEGRLRFSVTHHDFNDWRSGQSSFAAMTGFRREDVTVSGGDARPIRRNATYATPDLFAVLGIPPALGRPFVEGDGTPGASPVAVVSHGLWQNRFAGDPSVLGRDVTVDGTPHTIVGIMPERFGFPENEDLYVPLPLALDRDRTDSENFGVIARLRDGITRARAVQDLETIAAALATTFPASNIGVSASLLPYGEELVPEEFARGLYTMLAAVSFVLLIACVNVANLLLARALGRQREIAVRTALGASRRRILSQFLMESFVLATTGGVIGTLVAWGGVSLFRRTLTELVGLAWVDIRIDIVVLTFVGGVVGLGTLLAGVLPALQATRVDVNGALKDGSRGEAGASKRAGRLGRGLVVIEVAASCVLLVVSGLLIKGVLELRAVDLGLPADELVTAEIEVPRQVYPTAEQRVRFFEELEMATTAIPGVRDAALMSDIPGTVGFRIPVTVPGREGGDERTGPVGIMTVTPGFLEVLDAAVLEGRGFSASDRAGAEPVVVVNRAFAEQYLGGRAGGQVVLGQTARTIVGVVPNLLMGSMDEPDVNGPGIYLPFAQSGNVSMQLMARVPAGDPRQAIPQIQRVVASLDPNLAVSQVDVVDRLIAGETAVFEIFGRMFLLFGLVALFLAALGLHGVMTLTVRRRTREWGVRMALGATGGEVLRLVTRQAVVHLALGLGIGLAVAGILAKPLATMFYRIQPWDVGVFALIAGLLSVTGLLAALGPAHRATRVDPLVALREE